MQLAQHVRGGGCRADKRATDCDFEIRGNDAGELFLEARDFSRGC